jgi:ribosomal protein L6P/L9E
MSRIGKKPISVPAGVTVDAGRRDRHGEGAPGELSRVLPAEVTPRWRTGCLTVTRPATRRGTRRFTASAGPCSPT